jgi:hypothetical protein
MSAENAAERGSSQASAEGTVERPLRLAQKGRRKTGEKGYGQFTDGGQLQAR